MSSDNLDRCRSHLDDSRSSYDTSNELAILRLAVRQLAHAVDALEEGGALRVTEQGEAVSDPARTNPDAPLSSEASEEGGAPVVAGGVEAGYNASPDAPPSFVAHFDGDTSNPPDTVVVGEDDSDGCTEAEMEAILDQACATDKTPTQRAGKLLAAWRSYLGVDGPGVFTRLMQAHHVERVIDAARAQDQVEIARLEVCERKLSDLCNPERRMLEENERLIVKCSDLADQLSKLRAPTTASVGDAGAFLPPPSAPADVLALVGECEQAFTDWLNLRAELSPDRADDGQYQWRELLHVMSKVRALDLHAARSRTKATQRVVDAAIDTVRCWDGENSFMTDEARELWSAAQSHPDYDAALEEK